MTITSVHARELTVSFEVTLAGDSRYHDAMHLLDGLRDLTDKLATDSQVRLEVTPEPTAAPVMDGGLRILPEARQVVLDGEPVALTRIEFDLLLFLAENPQRVFSRAQLLQQVWGYAHGGDRTVDVHVRRLRAKLGDVPIVTTLRGIGYRLADDVDVQVVRL